MNSLNIFDRLKYTKITLLYYVHAAVALVNLQLRL